MFAKDHSFCEDSVKNRIIKRFCDCKNIPSTNNSPSASFLAQLIKKSIKKEFTFCPSIISRQLISITVRANSSKPQWLKKYRWKTALLIQEMKRQRKANNFGIFIKKINKINKNFILISSH
jgi:hypothetical protein